MEGAPKDKTAITALQRFVRDGFQEFNPRDPRHIAAYSLARSRGGRPRARTVLDILNSEKETSSSGAKMSASFILAPRDNFPERVAPQWLQGYLVTEVELRQTFKVPHDLDLNQYFVCDSNTPTQRLGLRNRKISFDEITKVWQLEMLMSTLKGEPMVLPHPDHWQDRHPHVGTPKS